MNHPARTTDISTSHEAARHVVDSGLQQHQQACAIVAVRQNPGLTSAELAAATGLDRFMLARRLPEALADGLVFRGEARKCDISGRRACTWFPDAATGNDEPLAA